VINTINIITRLINKSYCFGKVWIFALRISQLNLPLCGQGNEINNKIVEKQVKKEIEINNLLFN